MANNEEIIDAGRLGEIRRRLGKDLPEDWELTTLGDAFKWGSGGTPKRTNPRFYGGDIPWLIIGDLHDGVVMDSETTITEDGLKESSAKWVEPGSVLLAMYGSIGKLGIAGRRLTTNQAIAFTKPDPVDAKYLFYYLTYTRGDLASLGKGATQKNISQAVIKAFPFVLAPPEQQERIVAEIEKQFSRLDEAVANLKRVKANLKRYKAAVLKTAVEGRLVETEAELSRREGRSYETGEQLLQRILESRRSQWKGKGKYKEPAGPAAASLPELPEGWVWATVESLSMKVTDGVHKKPSYVAGGIPFVTVKNLTAGDGISFDELNYVTPEDHAEFCKRTHPERGDILISKDGTLGVVRLIETDRVFSVFVSVALVKPVSYDLSRYLVTAFESPVVQRQMVPKGSGLQHIHLEDLRADCIPVPPLAEQHRIVAEVDRRFSLLRETEALVDVNLQRTERLRQSILASAFAGRIDQRSGMVHHPDQALMEGAI